MVDLSCEGDRRRFEGVFGRQDKFDLELSALEETVMLVRDYEGNPISVHNTSLSTSENVTRQKGFVLQEATDLVW